MKPTLADSLNIILPDLATEIASPEAHLRLQKLAQLLPPTRLSGFECRLSQGIFQVDLQQCISAKDHEPKILAKQLVALALSNTILKPLAWQRIQQFCQAWLETNSALHEGITEIWLEFDIDESNSLTPSIFLSFNTKITDSSKALYIAETALGLLWDQPLTEPLKSNLSQCFTSCTAPVRISHLGVMLSRQLQALRLNVSHLASEQITYYLENVGFPDVVDEIKTLTVQLLDFVDQVRICLDVGTSIYPNIGLECFFAQKLESESRWSAFLNHLVKQGLCTSEKRQALLAWLGYVTPQSSPHPWPNNLIAESLLQPPHHFSAFARRLSHIKLVYFPQHPLQAKAYLEFSHQWLESDLSQQEQVEIFT